MPLSCPHFLHHSFLHPNLFFFYHPRGGQPKVVRTHPQDGARANPQEEACRKGGEKETGSPGNTVSGMCDWNRRREIVKERDYWMEHYIDCIIGC